MGKVVKKAWNETVDAVKKAPQTVGKSAVDLGKSLVGANGGNYFKNLGESTVNAATVGLTGGMTSTKDLGSGTNNLDTQAASLMGKGPSLELPDTNSAPAMSAEENAALKEEEMNAKRKGRASTVLAGGNDSVGSTSAKKTLLGSL